MTPTSLPSTLSRTPDLPRSFRACYAELPDADFFKSFEDHFEAFSRIGEGASALRSAALEATLGVTEVELQRRRAIDAPTAERFAALLAEAYRTGAMNHPEAFLKSLSKTDLEVIRKAQSLAEPICVESLSREGAYNLLLPGGYKVDFNRDGISEIGCAAVCFFPPLDAPEAFRRAWLRATEGMNEEDLMVQSLTLWGCLYSIDGANPSLAHRGDLRTDEWNTYSRMLQERLKSNEAFRGFLAPGQYERDKAFYNRLLDLMAGERGVEQSQDAPPQGAL